LHGKLVASVATTIDDIKGWYWQDDFLLTGKIC